MNLRQEIYNLLQEIGPGRMSPTAYDTAWVARLAEIGEPIGRQALDWIRAHQLEDGSWGAEQPYYHHDRVICTLAAMSALAQQGDSRDRARLTRAKRALQKALSGLDSDPAGATIGFEMIVPTLVNEAQALGIIDRQATKVIEHLAPKRSAKLAVLPEGMINRFVTLGFSAEMAGSDGIQLLDIENLQESDGSISYSPSATAYFALYVRRGDERALQYLQNLAKDGSIPNVAPFDVFEPSWVLWNFKHLPLDAKMRNLCQSHLDFLESSWMPGKGVGFAANYGVKDGDCTSITYDVLAHFDRSLDLDAIFRYESPYYFRCFEMESTPSISTNIHVLSALKEAGLDKRHLAVQKVIHFLSEIRAGNPFWLDKWHASPYYTTGHAVISCIGYDDDLAYEAIRWIIDTQNDNGSWGYYSIPTAEETAYCLQSLAIWDRETVNSVPDGVLEKGTSWLVEHMAPPYPPLWIGKCLYCPEWVVRSAILSALELVI